jgi:5-hydroxyisourate hydrolase
MSDRTEMTSYRCRNGSWHSTVSITVYVYDCMRGAAAGGVPVRLDFLADGSWEPLGQWLTDDDGLIDGAAIQPGGRGMHRLTLGLDGYFVTLGVGSVFPAITIDFRVADPAEPLYLPVYVGPNSYSCYHCPGEHRGPGHPDMAAEAR